MTPQPRKAYGDYEAVRQLKAANVWPHLTQLQISELAVRAIVVNINALVITLRARPEWQEGILHGLHPEIGPERVDFRAHRGTFGKGSLQIVMDKTMGRFYADVDAGNPYEDVVGFVIHSGEVIGNAFQNWFRRKPSGAGSAD